MAEPEESQARPLRLAVAQLDFLPRAITLYDDLWIPAAPLAALHDKSGKGHSQAAYSPHRLFSAAAVFNEIEQLSINAVMKRIREVLNFVKEYHADVVVFPEYLVPVSCLQVLKEFSEGCAIVAGLEQVRNSGDAQQLAIASDNYKDSRELLSRNVSAVVADKHVHLVTKKYLAHEEIAMPGAGTLLTKINLSGQPVALGIAVCMDFLRSEEDLRHRGAEIICIPACSPNLQAFRPDAPRDHIRLFANCSAYGGSQIFMPGLRGALSYEMGVQPFSPGFEGVMIVEFDRFPQSPSPIRRTENRLLVRAQLIEKAGGNSAIDRMLQHLCDAQEQPGIEEDLPAKLVPLLKEIDTESPFAEAVQAYLHSLAMRREDSRLGRIANTHLIVEAGMRSEAIRRSQAKLVLSRLDDEALLAERAPAGAARDAYKELLSNLPEASSPPQSTQKQASGSIGKLTQGISAPAPGTAGNASTPHPEAAAGASPADSEDAAKVHHIHASESWSVRAEDTLTALPSGFHICDELILKSQGLLDAISELATAAFPAGDAVAVSRCRSRAAKVADQLSELDQYVSGRVDFDWTNTFGSAQQNLAILRNGLPATSQDSQSRSSRQLSRSSLRKTALKLHKAISQLKDLIE